MLTIPLQGNTPVAVLVRFVKEHVDPGLLGFENAALPQQLSLLLIERNEVRVGRE